MAGDGSAHGGFIAGVGGARCLAHHAGLHVIARPALHLRIPAPTSHALLPLPLAATHQVDSNYALC